MFLHITHYGCSEHTHQNMLSYITCHGFSQHTLYVLTQHTLWFLTKHSTMHTMVSHMPTMAHAQLMPHMVVGSHQFILGSTRVGGNKILSNKSKGILKSPVRGKGNPAYTKSILDNHLRRRFSEYACKLFSQFAGNYLFPTWPQHTHHRG